MTDLVLLQKTETSALQRLGTLPVGVPLDGISH